MEGVEKRTKSNKEVVVTIIDKTKPVLVTGGTGYVASWIIKILLEERINVNATVRDPSDVQKVEHLVALAKASPGKLKLFIHSLGDRLPNYCFGSSPRSLVILVNT